MIAPLDPFALRFDAITPDPALAARTLDDPTLRIPLESEAAGVDTPGFFLLNDANGRFVVDRDMGVISVASDDVLETERDAIYLVRLKVVEPSGAAYELDLRLKLDGHVPQIAEAGEFGEIPPLETEIELVVEPLPEPELETTPEPTPVAAVLFAAYRAFEFAHIDPLGGEEAAFGALIETPALASEAEDGATLALDAAPPAPSPRFADWSL